MNAQPQRWEIVALVNSNVSANPAGRAAVFFKLR
jgi:hypothetical protein